MQDAYWYLIRNYLKSGLLEGQISNGPALTMAKLWTKNYKTGPFEIWMFLSGFQMAGLSDFRSHSKSRPFASQPLYIHLKSKLVWISDPHCIKLHIVYVLEPANILPVQPARYCWCRFQKESNEVQFRKCFRRVPEKNQIWVSCCVL